MDDADPLSVFAKGMDRVIPKIWCNDKPGAISLNLGAGKKSIPGSIPLGLPKWDADRNRIPYNTDSVSKIYAFHFFEHLANPLYCLRECERVLEKGGYIWIVVPYGVSDCALQDLDHKTRFVEDTWKNTFYNDYYEDKNIRYLGRYDTWQFEIGYNMIMGLSHRNLVLVTQLIKG